MTANLISLLLNAVTVLWTVVAVWTSLFRNEKGIEKKFPNTKTFRYFTTDSNILAAVSALCVLPFSLKALSGGTLLLPGWVHALKLVGTTAVTVTFLTVVLFLGPAGGYRKLLSGHGFYLHLLSAVFTLVSFCFCENTHALTLSEAFLGMIPTAVYGILYLVMVIFIGPEKGGWEDFYGYNRGGKWYVSFVAMFAGTAAICVLIRLVHNLGV